MHAQRHPLAIPHGGSGTIAKLFDRKTGIVSRRDTAEIRGKNMKVSLTYPVSGSLRIAFPDGYWLEVAFIRLLAFHQHSIMRGGMALPRCCN